MIENYRATGVGILGAPISGQLQQYARQGTISERLKWKKDLLDRQIKQAQIDLESVNYAIERLDNAPEIEKALEALSKAGVL